MKIGGLASGIDTETIVKDLMKAERIPLDKLTQKKQYFEWQLNDYRTANRNLKDYSTKLFDNSILSKNFNQKNVTVSSPDDVSIRSKGNSEDFSGTIQVNELATNATMQGKGLGKDAKVDGILEKGTLEITVPGDAKVYKVEISGDEKSFEEVAKKITEQSGVRAFYDSDTGAFGLSAKESGGYTASDYKNPDSSAPSNSYIQIGNTELAQKLKLVSSTGEIDAENQRPGKNAEFTYNGMDMTRSSNTFELDGMQITLKAASQKNITFSATTDTEKVFENIKGFVDDYNKLIEDLNKKIREPVYRSFQPLSAEQKKELSDKEVEQWEEKAMSGTLRNDPELKSMLIKLRNVMTRPIKIGEEGEGADKKDITISLSDIGITTSKNYLDNGKLVIDEKKLKEAIAQNPQGVEKLFNNDGKTDKDTGIARQLRAEVDATQKNIQKSAGKLGDTNKAFSLGRTLDNMNKQIERFETRLQMSETRYWKQFNAMENAIQRANAQSASLMSSLGGGM